MLYTEFTIVSGKGESNISYLSAFDLALMDAGVAHLNLVRVSSIIPPNAEFTNRLPTRHPGEITHCVISLCTGTKGQAIASSIGCVRGNPYGVVAEISDQVETTQIRKSLKLILNQMISERNISVITTHYRISKIKNIAKEYGAVVVVLVFSRPSFGT